jgi:DinB superfamily
MISSIQNIINTRSFLLDSINDLSAEQLNNIPPSFNNNIIWNVGHLIAAQQGICYVRAGLQPTIPDQYFINYRNGTRPEAVVGLEEIETIKTLLLSSLQQTNDDYHHQKFTNYTAWTTRYGVEIKDIDDALKFLAFHEGLHFGYILALKKMVTQPA